MKCKARVFSAVLIGSLLTACSSVGDVKSQPPALSVSSQKSAKEVAGCISDRLTDKYSSFVHTHSTRLTTKGYSLVWEQQVGGWGKTVAATIDVNEAKETSDKKSDVTTYFSWDLIGSVKQNVIVIVESCAK